MKKIFLSACVTCCILSCNNSTPATGTNPDASTGNRDSISGSHSSQSTGTDLNGGTNQQGTITDTSKKETGTVPNP